MTPSHTVSDVHFTDELHIAIGENYIVGYDAGTATVYKLTPDNRFVRGTFCMHITAIAAFDSSVVFVVGFHDVFIARAGDFPGGERLLFSDADRVVKIIADCAIGIIAVLTSESKLKTVAAAVGRQLGEIDFKGEPVHALVIAETWHVIVVQSNLSLIVATMHGVVLKQRTLYKPIRCAIAFRIANRNDFVAYVDSEGMLAIFEVMYPEKALVVGKLKDEVVRMQYLREQRWVVALQKNGCFARSSFPQIGQPGK